MAVPIYSDSTRDDLTQNVTTLEPTFNQSLQASIRSAWLQSYGPVGYDYASSLFSQTNEAKLNKEAATRRVTDAGLDPKQFKTLDNFTDSSLDIAIDRQRELQRYREIDERTPYSAIGTPVRGLAQFGAGIVDPINVATAFFPAGKLAQAVKWGWAAKGIAGLETTARTGATFAERSIARAGVGAIEGTVGTAVLEAPYSYMREQLGDDYTTLDSMQNIAFGGALGLTLHTGGGAIGDVVKGLRAKGKLPTNIATTTAPDGITPIEADITPQQFTEAKASQLNDVIGQPVQLRDENLSDKVMEASLAFKSIDETTLQNLSIKEDLRNAVEVNPLEATAETSMLRDYISKPTTTSAMLARVYNDYHNQIDTALKAEGKDKTGQLSLIDKAQVLRNSIDKVQPSVQEVVNAVSPVTREMAMRVATEQMANGNVPTVEQIINSDKAIGTATKEDIVNQTRSNIQKTEQQYIDNISSIDELRQSKKVYTEIDRDDFTASEQASKALDADNAAKLEQLKLDNLYSKVIAEPKTFDEFKQNWVKDLEKQRVVFTPTEKQQLLNSQSRQEFVDKLTKHYSLSDQELQDLTTTPKDILIKSLEQSFGKDTKALFDKGIISIVSDEAELPWKEKANNVKAVYRGGKVYVVAKNITPQQAKGILLHEVGIHAGMEKFLGVTKFKQLQNEFKKLIDSGDARANIAMRQVPSDTPEQYKLHEAIAYYVERAPETSFVKSILAAIKAWLYKNYNIGTLSQADYVALAKASLRKYARDAEARDNPDVIRYSKDETKSDIEIFRQQVNAIDEAMQLANRIAEVLPTIDTTTSTAFTIELRNQFKEITTDRAETLAKRYLRKVNTLSNKIANGNVPAYAVGLTPQEWAAKIVMADEYQKIRVEKSNIINNYRASSQGIDLVANQFKGQEYEGLKALLVGSNLIGHEYSQGERIGSRNSTALLQTGYSNRLETGLLSSLERSGVYEYAIGHTLDTDISRAIFALNRGTDTHGINENAITIAKHINEAYDASIALRNERGAFIRKNKDYVLDNHATYDQIAVRKVTLEEFRQKAIQDWDLERMAELQDLTVDEIIKEIDTIYTDFAKGVHGIDVETLEDPEASTFNPGANITKKLSAHRTIVYKDAEAFMRQFQAYSGGNNILNGVFQSLHKAGKQAAMLEKLGPNYELNLQKIINRTTEQIEDPQRAADFYKKANSYAFEHAIPYLTGEANNPVSARLARVRANISAIERMAYMGGSVLSAVTDLPNAAANLKLRSGKGYLSSIPEIAARMLGYGSHKAEKEAMLGAIGIYNESNLTGVLGRNGDDSRVGNFINKLEHLYYKINLLAPWTHKIHIIHGDILMHEQGLNAQQLQFSELSKSAQGFLKAYNINEREWTLLKQMILTDIDGRVYLDPANIESIRPQMRADISNKYPDIDAKLLEQYTTKELNALKENLSNYYLDSIAASTAEPGAKTKILLKAGTQSGTPMGELINSIVLFKSFPVSVLQNVVGPQVYSRGYDSLADFIKRGKGDILGFAQYIASSFAFGYLAMTLKDLIAGKKPKDPTDWKTYLAAATQSGGLGIYGDFLFGATNRYGTTPIETLAGPFLNDLGQLFNILYANPKTAIEEGKPTQIGADLAKFGLNHVPFLNLFYLKQTLNYLVLYNIAEQMNPGYLRRMQRRAEKNGTEYWLPIAEPTNALQY